MKIFIINLKRSLERKKLMQKQIERFFENYPNLKDEISFEFFEAIDAKIKENMEKFTSYFPKFRSLAFCGRGGCGILDTELACFASHLSLWQKCVELNEAVLILEDDFYFEGGGGDFAEFLNFLKETPYEFVKVKFRNYGYKHIKDKLYLCEKRFSFGAFAYYIKPSAALKWLDNLKKMYYPIDFYTDMFYIHKVMSYIWVDENFKLKIPENEQSVIGSQVKSRFFFIAKLVRPFWKFYWHLRFYVFFLMKSLKS